MFCMARRTDAALLITSSEPSGAVVAAGEWITKLFCVGAAGVVVAGPCGEVGLEGLVDCLFSAPPSGSRIAENISSKDHRRSSCTRQGHSRLGGNALHAPA